MIISNNYSGIKPGDFPTEVINLVNKVRTDHSELFKHFTSKLGAWWDASNERTMDIENGAYHANHRKIGVAISIAGIIIRIVSFHCCLLPKYLLFPVHIDNIFHCGLKLVKKIVLPVPSENRIVLNSKEITT